MKLFQRPVKGLVAGGTPRVNLLPPKEMANRANAELWRRWMRAFVAAILVVALEEGIGASWTIRSTNRQTENSRVSEQLQSELAAYSEVIELRARVMKLENLRAQAGSNDQGWGPLINDIKAVLPKGVTLIGFRLVPGAASVPGTDAAAEVGLRGNLTFAAKATSAQAETVTRLRKVDTFLDVDAGALASDGPSGGFTFVTTFSADQTRYTGRFVQTGGK